MNKVEIEYIKQSNAILKYYTYMSDTKPDICCPVYVGRNGVGKMREGDYKTPSGVFHFTRAFGFVNSPETSLEYTKITEKHYWCTDSNSSYYNQLIDIDEIELPFKNGEHLAEFPDAYRYALAIDYNLENEPNVGSAIFFHCKVPKHTYTAGCVAIDGEVMRELFKVCDNTTTIWIH